MLSPINTMFLHYPLRAWSTVLIMVMISWYAFRRIRVKYQAGALTRQRGMAGWLLISYLLLLLFLAVLGRRTWDYDRVNLEPWYSYRDVLVTGDREMALQIAANIAAFVPVGILGGLAAKHRGFLKTLLLGIVISVCIETLQFLLRCGTAEIDDLISNSIGTLIGCVIGCGVNNLISKQGNK